MTEIAKRISIAMKIRDLKQTELVKKTGISKGAMSCYISGKYIPKNNNLTLIATALNVNVDWLIGNAVPMERQERSTSSNLVNAENVINIYHLSEDIACRLDNLSLDEESFDEYETIRKLAWKMVQQVKKLTATD